MTLSCIEMIDVWNWLNDSQLVSTLLILLFGTFAFESWLKRKEATREMIWWLINHIEEYAVIANDYWSEHPTKATKQLVRAARLKSEYCVLLTSVDNVGGVSKNLKKDLRESITALYEAATGGEFETAKKPSQSELTKTLAAIAKHSADLRRVLRTTVS